MHRLGEDFKPGLDLRVGHVDAAQAKCVTLRRGEPVEHVLRFRHVRGALPVGHGDELRDEPGPPRQDAFGAGPVRVEVFDDRVEHVEAVHDGEGADELPRPGLYREA